MSWDSIVALIVRFGVETAYRIYDIAKQGEPDEAAWEKLRALALTSYDDYIKAARERAGLPPLDPPPA